MNELTPEALAVAARMIGMAEADAAAQITYHRSKASGNPIAYLADFAYRTAGNCGGIGTMSSHWVKRKCKKCKKLFLAHVRGRDLCSECWTDEFFRIRHDPTPLLVKWK